jgi:hypothetical protein
MYIAAAKTSSYRDPLAIFDRRGTYLFEAGFERSVGFRLVPLQNSKIVLAVLLGSLNGKAALTTPFGGIPTFLDLRPELQTQYRLAAFS